MTDKLKQTIEREVEEMPKEAQEAISSLDWVKLAENIGNKYGLEVEEIEDFQLETLLVLTGTVDPQFYAVNIESQINTTKEKAEELANAALEQIFTPIKIVFEGDMKKKMKNSPAKWDQSVDFVLSGGNYAAFMDQKIIKDETDAEGTVLPSFSIKDEHRKK